MINMYTARTSEIDEIDEALAEIESQIDFTALKKNSGGLIFCHIDFVESGVVAALCEMLPFDVIGMTSMANADEHGYSLFELSLTVLTSDEVSMTASAIADFLHQGADMIVVTGGMSVDPDDRTPAAIRASGAQILSYGAPVYPGAMFLLAYASGPGGRVPVLGLPGCVMYHKASIFDLIVPRLLAGVEVTAEDIAALGHGGFCAGCPECAYPVCPFGT